MIPTRVAQGGRPWAVLACIYCTGLYRQHTYRLLAVSLPVAPFAGEYSIGYGYSRLSPPLSPQPPPVLLLLLLPPRAEGQRKTLLACTGSSRSTTAALCQLHYASFHTAGMGWQLLLHPPPPRLPDYRSAVAPCSNAASCSAKRHPCCEQQSLLCPCASLVPPQSCWTGSCGC
jgi:hypothetical protein